MNPVEPQIPLHSGPESEHRTGLSQLPLWMAATLAGMVTGVLVARQPFFEAVRKRLGGGRRGGRKPSPAQSLPMLASAIVGSTKATIEAVFGPPRSAAVAGVGVVVQSESAFWAAGTWYYPLPQHGAVALAIRFDDDLAAGVEFLAAPHLSLPHP